ncbi:hypothetical protein OGAPHI_005427 [Ogataea philodendri]|uniref:Uncharacterized protein n=1 Tax=Ogataea philodendri TaxID=1378263 RepID=A0A9P8T1I2_9ASCO|nr:uncharacterized protein OGAPHI_005427 [Ogataea philodendri]KAH3662179.1 hypothetical protein OGAPHI_005427 [Ogataea philodendri]
MVGPVLGMATLGLLLFRELEERLAPLEHALLVLLGDPVVDDVQKPNVGHGIHHLLADPATLLHAAVVELGEINKRDSVGSHCNTCFQQAFGLAETEVGDSNGTDFAGVQQLLHGFPGVDIVDICWLGRRRLQKGSLVAGKRIMHQIQVNVIQLELFQALLQSRQHILWSVVGIPQLRGDKDIFTVDAAVLDSIAHLGLIAVDGGSVDVLVAVFQGVLDSKSHLVGLGLPGS